jgi:CDP-glucose 4,6-dehydratase
LEPLSGYLLVGQKLLEKRKDCATSWNFGPKDEGNVCVGHVLKAFKKYWDKIDYQIDTTEHPHEATLLRLDCSKAHHSLQWQPVWSSEIAFKKTIQWYKNYYEHDIVYTIEDFNAYIQDAQQKGRVWASK